MSNSRIVEHLESLPTSRVRDAGPPATPPVPAENRADEHAQHGAAECMVERQAVAQSMLHGQHPLMYGD